MIHAKVGFEVIQILVNFVFSLAAILDFEKLRHFRCLGCVKTKLHDKFGENRTNGLGVIQAFVNFKMAADGHLGLRILRFLDHRLVPGGE